jgi:hypothetical protein
MLVDVKCPKCGTVYEDNILFSKNDVVECSVCKVNCDRLNNFDCTFRLVYDNKKDICSWGAENYSRSQYWDKQDAMAKGNIFPVTGRK